MPKPILRLLFPTLIACLGFSACRYMQKPNPEPLPISRRLTWDGLAPDNYSVSPALAADSPADSGLVEVHEFEFAGGMDTVQLRLQEYRPAFLAYAAFQNQADFAEMSDGYFRKGNSLVFYHGPFLGEARFSQGGMLPSHFLKEKLSFQGEPLFITPPEFASFPLLGRIPHSERVIAKHFLGRNWQGPVFSVSYRCHGDTATAFRAHTQDPRRVHTWFQEWLGKTDTLGRGRDIHFQGWDAFQRPLVLWVSADAVMGMEGCFDLDLASEYTRKLDKMRGIWSEP